MFDVARLLSHEVGMVNQTIWNEFDDKWSELSLCEKDCYPSPADETKVDESNVVTGRQLRESECPDDSSTEEKKSIGAANSTSLQWICVMKDKKKWLLDSKGVCIPKLIVLSYHGSAMSTRNESSVEGVVGVYPSGLNDSFVSPVPLVEVETQDNVFEGIVPIGPIKQDKKLLKMRIDYASSKAGRVNGNGVIHRLSADCEIEGHVRRRRSLRLQQVQIRSQRMPRGEVVRIQFGRNGDCVAPLSQADPHRFDRHFQLRAVLLVREGLPGVRQCGLSHDLVVVHRILPSQGQE